MTPVAKALWFIETHTADEITLADIAGVAGVSRFHLVRAFATATGWPVMRYVRARRLTEAARALAAGAPDILRVALDAGYGSHEAFTRAFRDQFGTTPDAVRARRSVHHLTLMEPKHMATIDKQPLQQPRMEEGRPLLLAGFTGRFSFDNTAGLPALWQRFAQHFGQVPGQVGFVGYGACYNTDDSGAFDYMAGVEVRDFADLPDDYARLRVPAHRYAVFTHTDHVASVQGTFAAIFNDWLPALGMAPDDAPVLERYDERFNPMTGMGGFEIWVPVRA